MYAAIQRAVNCTLKSLSVRDNGTDNSTENGHIFIHFLISFAVHITDTASTVNREEASQTSVGGMRDLLIWICWWMLHYGPVAWWSIAPFTNY